MRYRHLCVLFCVSIAAEQCVNCGDTGIRVQPPPIIHDAVADLRDTAYYSSIHAFCEL